MFQLICEGIRVSVKPLKRNMLPVAYALWKEFEDAASLSDADRLIENIDFDQFTALYNEALRSAKFFMCTVNHAFNDEIIGLLAGRIFTQRGCVWINTFVISKRHRRKALGTETLKTIEQYFSCKHNVSKICLICSCKNKSGLNFWLSNGYNILKNFPSNLSKTNITDSVVLIKKL